MRIPLTRVGKADEGDAMYPGRKDVADKKKRRKTQKRMYAKKRKRDRRTISRRAPHVKDSPRVPTEYKVPPATSTTEIFG